jgi:hypothetical protein
VQKRIGDKNYGNGNGNGNGNGKINLNNKALKYRLFRALF